MRANVCASLFIALLSRAFAYAPVAHAYDDSLVTVCFNAAVDKQFSPQALDACTRTIEDKTAPKHIHLVGLDCRAKLYATNGMLDRAAADLTAYIRLAPDEPGGYRQRGQLRMKQSDYRGAVADITSALNQKTHAQNASEWALAYYTRAQAFEQLGKLDRALADYRNAGLIGKEDAERLQARQ
jgi:tetratricopeptide (TPR) repeat protein